MTDLARLADERAWRAARLAVKRAAPGYRLQARRRLRRLAHALLARDVAAAGKGRARA